MDQVGYAGTETGQKTEQPGSEHLLPAGHAEEGGASLPPRRVSVYRAVPDSPLSDASDSSAEPAFAAEPTQAQAPAPAPAPAPDDESPIHTDSRDFEDGFTGTLTLANLESFDDATTGQVLERIAHLISWAQAQQARLLTRMETIFRDTYAAASGRVEPGMAFSLAAAECAAILHLPQLTTQRLMIEADALAGSRSATLEALEQGRFSYQHAQVVLEQCESVPTADQPAFEADLLTMAEGHTRAQFSVRARRLREKSFPQTIPERHRSAFEQRRVCLDREEDGMSWLSVFMRAAEAQQIHTALSTAAQGEQLDGDPRTKDQLRADILTQLLMGGLGGGQRHGDGSPATTYGTKRSGTGGPSTGPARAGFSDFGLDSASRSGDDDVDPTGVDDDVDSTEGRRGDGGTRQASANKRTATRYGNSGSNCGDSGVDGTSQTADADRVMSGTNGTGVLPRAEIMVLINAETLFGADDRPAELHGYGPISAEEARRLARNALNWTGLVQDPHTGEILGVGRRRKVPAGLARWLRARDATCRFPGCRVSTAVTEIDHTTDWARGGTTDHGNLAHLCRRHHRFKTLGLWTARQSSPGVLEWTSPSGRVYRTEPFLQLAPPRREPDPVPVQPPPF